MFKTDSSNPLITDHSLFTQTHTTVSDPIKHAKTILYTNIYFVKTLFYQITDHFMIMKMHDTRLKMLYYRERSKNLKYK